MSIHATASYCRQSEQGISDELGLPASDARSGPVDSVQSSEVQTEAAVQRAHCVLVGEIVPTAMQIFREDKKQDEFRRDQDA